MDCQGLLIIYYKTSNRENYDIENMPDKLEVKTRTSRSVVGQEAIEGS